MDAVQIISKEFRLRPEQVEGVLALFKEGAAVPFVFRYRPEKIGQLKEDTLFAIKERWRAINAITARRQVVLNSIKAQNKLNDVLQAKVEAAQTRQELDDLYLPFNVKPNRAGFKAREQGLEPLAEQILKQETVPQAAAADAAKATSADEFAIPFLSAEKGVPDSATALAGARAILAERFAQDAEIRSATRKLIHEEAKWSVKAAEGVDLAKSRYSQVATFNEQVSKVPLHKLQTILRGEQEKKLTLVLDAPKEKLAELLKSKAVIKTESPLAGELEKTLDEALNKELLPALEHELRLEARLRCDLVWAEHFGKTLRALLMQPPFGRKVVMGVAVDKRVGVRAVVLGADDQVLDQGAIPLDPSEESKKHAREGLSKFIKTHNVEGIAMGSGPETRAAEIALKELLNAEGLGSIPRLVVNDASALSWATGKQSRVDYPGLDNIARVALSLARRLHDTMAELARVQPRAVGPYLAGPEPDGKVAREKFEEVLASCAGRVGVDVNRASVELLTSVSGLNPNLAAAVVVARKAKDGGFKSREEFKEIPGIGAKEYEQMAGFLKITSGARLLDATGVHPERYPLVEKAAELAGISVADLIGNSDALAKLDWKKLEGEGVNEVTLKHLAAELKQGISDPRGPFTLPVFNEGVSDVKAVQPGQILNGVVSNITPFGAFVDLGLSQDGLIHISELSHKFVRDPSEVIRLGQAVKVKVLSIDQEKQRLALSLKALEEPAAPKPPKHKPRTGSAEGGPRPPRPPRPGGRGPRGPGGRPIGAPTTPGATPATGEAAAAGTATSEGAKPGDRGPRSGNRRPNRDNREGARTGGGPRPAGAGGGPGGKKDGERRGRPAERPAPAPKPGMPDYSKFFVKGKRPPRETDKNTGKGIDREKLASRDEVRATIKTQSKGGSTLADLLKKAGVDDAAE